MHSADLEVLEPAQAWLSQGAGVVLATVARTWGASPRPPGSLLAIRHDGRMAGSVSGGCVDEDLRDRVRAGEFRTRPQAVRYGGTAESCARFRLPCGGTVELVAEPLAARDALAPLLERTRARQLTRRCVRMADGRITLGPAARGTDLAWDGAVLDKVFGPQWRLVLVGAGQVSRPVAEMGLALDYEVVVCEPRADYAAAWDLPGTRLVRDMPDDAVRSLANDARSAVLALSHDPKLDDLALLDALPSEAFFVGALGSHANQAARRERLALLGLAPEAIARLHGPVGLPIGSRTPAEIAVAIHAELTLVRRRQPQRPAAAAAPDTAEAARA